MATKSPAKKSVKKAAKIPAKKTVKDLTEKVVEQVKKAVGSIRPDPDSPLNKGDVTTAVAITEPVSPDAHAEAQLAVESENKDFAVSVGSQSSINEVSEIAWNQIKDASDPEWKDCAETHKQRFLSHAQSIWNGGRSLGGDSPLARFEAVIVELKRTLH